MKLHYEATVKRKLENGQKLNRTIKEDIHGSIDLDKDTFKQILLKRTKRMNIILEKAGYIEIDNLLIDNYELTFMTPNSIDNTLEFFEEIIEEQEIREDNILDFLYALKNDKDFKGLSNNILYTLINKDYIKMNK